jgi:hypothetical protein
MRVDFQAGHRATSKATMCPEINRYDNYGPVPKKVRLELPQVPPARVSHLNTCRESFCERATGRARPRAPFRWKTCTAGSRRKLAPPLGGVSRRSSGGSIKLRRRHGAARVAWCAYKQTRNVLSFHGHYARDSTFYQGFRLGTGGGGSASCSECNGLATGLASGRCGLCWERSGSPPRRGGAGWKSAGAGSASAHTSPPLGSNGS